MSLQGFLTILLAVELFVITVCIVVVSFYLVKALKSIIRFSDSLRGMKPFLAIPALIIALLSKLIKKGRG